MSTDQLAPIVFFVYNRLEHTMKTIEALKENPEAENSLLYIFSDGPKMGSDDNQLKKIRNVREYIHSITGFKDIFIAESPTNKGLATSTIEGISSVINKYGKVIMLEDDDAPSPFFLAFENECLEKFKDNEKYWIVSGYVDNKVVPPKNDSDVFSVYRNSSWGFGTWARCWNKIIWDIPTLKGMFRHIDVIKGFAEQGGMDLPNMMIDLFNGKNNSWSIRMEFSRYLNNGMTILPSNSLIRNIGLDGTGVHCIPKDMNVTMMPHKVSVPEEIPFYYQGDKQLKQQFTARGIAGVLFQMGIYHRLKGLLKPYKF